MTETTIVKKSQQQQQNAIKNGRKNTGWSTEFNQPMQVYQAGDASLVFLFFFLSLLRAEEQGGWPDDLLDFSGLSWSVVILPMMHKY